MAVHDIFIFKHIFFIYKKALGKYDELTYCDVKCQWYLNSRQTTGTDQLFLALRLYKLEYKRIREAD